MQEIAINAYTDEASLPLFAYTNTHNRSMRRRRKRTIADFSLGVRRAPSLLEAGQIVVIGNPESKSSADRVWIGWCPIDQELELLDTIRESTRKHNLMILAYDNATSGEVLQVRERLVGSQLWGNWYRQTKLVKREVNSIIGELE